MDAMIQFFTRKKVSIKPESVVFFGRRWFNKRTGNVYHTVSVYADGKFLEKSMIKYGYGDAYIQTGLEILQKHGYFDPDFEDGFGYASFMRWVSEYERAIFEVADVECKLNL